MNNTMRCSIKIILTIIHLIIVFFTAVAVLVIDDIYLLIGLFILQILVYTSIILNDGCVLSKYELIGGETMTSTYIGKKAFFLSDSIKNSDFEKMFVGIPLGLLALKIILLLFPIFEYKKFNKNMWCIPKMPIVNNPSNFLKCVNKEIPSIISTTKSKK